MGNRREPASVRKSLRYHANSPLLSLKEAEEILWTDVNSLTKGLSAIRKEVLINALEGFQIMRRECSAVSRSLLCAD